MEKLSLKSRHQRVSTPLTRSLHTGTAVVTSGLYQSTPECLLATREAWKLLLAPNLPTTGARFCQLQLSPSLVVCRLRRMASLQIQPSWQLLYLTRPVHRLSQVRLAQAWATRMECAPPLALSVHSHLSRLWTGATLTTLDWL